eukprot:TRINITY_DN1758_c0_g2_i2.p1 TRINITY_DN1758_c0_g2~~TRINITY_DN1758_c0_g2_i2.p1  ORF type:complete len:677 (+),score=226.34 TRINITY_DN1758_c0_g2_i2:42-2072(+)
MLPTHSIRRPEQKKKDGIGSLSSNGRAKHSMSTIISGHPLTFCVFLFFVVIGSFTFVWVSTTSHEEQVNVLRAEIVEKREATIASTTALLELQSSLAEAHSAFNEKVQQLSDTTFQLTLAQSSLKERATEVLSLKTQLSKAQEDSREAEKKLEELRAQEKLVESQKQELEKKLQELQRKLEEGGTTKKAPEVQRAADLSSKTPTNTQQQQDTSRLDPTDCREAVKASLKFAWDSYVAYAWGLDDLAPLSRSGRKWFNLGATIVDSIDTLYIMGLEDEYQKARDWIKNNLDNEQSHQESTFEITIRNLGGLLSIYELTKEKMFLDQAADLGERILKAFVSPTGYPEPKVDLKSRASSRNSVGRFVLAEVGTMQMEFLYLAYHTKNSTFAEKPMAVFKKLREMMPDDGLYPVYFDQGEGRKNNGGHMTLGAMADSFYEYELKLWLLTNKQYDGYRSMYEESSNGAIDKLVRESKAGHLFIEDVRNGRPQNRMEHLSCFSGGMFGLGSQEGAVSNPDKQLEVGAGLTETCFNSYKATKTGLGPEIFTFNENGEIIPGGQKYYILRPETVESLFVMWRLTHDQKYRDWGWLIFQAIEEYCRTPNGYSSVNNVDELPVKHDDVQHSFFMAETLKYLYLLFSPDDLIPLSDYVFNTEAHPLGIIRETSGTMPRDIHQHLMLF